MEVIAFTGTFVDTFSRTMNRFDVKYSRVYVLLTWGTRHPCLALLQSRKYGTERLGHRFRKFEAVWNTPSQCQLEKNSRHNEGTITGPLKRPQYDRAVMGRGVSGRPSIQTPRCQETPVSQTPDSLIDVCFSNSATYKFFFFFIKEILCKNNVSVQ